MKKRILLIVALIVLACVGAYLYNPKRILVRPAECEANDQDQYVYSPFRLLELSPCLHVTGIVRGVAPGVEDGDGLIDLEVDPPYKYTKNWMNDTRVHGYLHLEIVCYRTSGINQTAPIETCTRDPDPYTGALPQIGQRVWTEGRWVLDLAHGGHAELHPLYRWGLIE